MLTLKKISPPRAQRFKRMWPSPGTSHPARGATMAIVPEVSAALVFASFAI